MSTIGKSATYSGFNTGTAESLLLDAGAFFANFDIETDTFETARATKLIGATRGGGKFEAKPNIRAIPIDGVKGVAKGLQVIDDWTVTLEANIIEIKKETLFKGLASAFIASGEADVEDYELIMANNYISLEDYMDNVTFVGKISGKTKPVIIQVLNALNVEGLSLQTKDKDEAIIALKFTGAYDTTELNSPPFRIYYPKV